MTVPDPAENGPMPRYLGPLGDARVVTAITAVGLAGSWWLATRTPVPAWELDLTTLINDAHGSVATALYPVMQLGTVLGPIAVGIGILWGRRDRWLAGTTIVAGVVTYYAAKGVKELVGRERPLRYLPDILIREGDGSGLGFISGHSAVAAFSATMAFVALPRRWRWTAPVVAAAVGLARIVHGVHLPADVIGGWSFGVLVATGSLWVLDRITTPTFDTG